MTKTMFIEARWNGRILLGEEVLERLREENTKKVALFASVQFLALDDVKKQLHDEGYEVLTTKAKRTHKEGQVLGCDAYPDAFSNTVLEDADSIVYIGDGLFHPKALLLSQRERSCMKDIIVWDPVSESMRILESEEVKKQLDKTEANLKRFISAEKVGILVSVKPGQQFLDMAKRLKSELEGEQGKKAYIFIDDSIDTDQFENYPFIDAWVNTACPRIGLDDHMNVSKPLINSREAKNPTAALERLTGK
ncbi:MAG: diphthamide synthesis protein [Candidatus Woesearchaeota archaeon]